MRRIPVTLTAVTGVLIGAVAAIVVAVACPHSGDASTVPASELVGVASDVLRHAHSILVHEPAVIVALALRGAVVARMTGLITAAVVNFARINGALLPGRRKNVKVTRRVLQPFYQLNLVGSRVLLRSVDPAKLEIRPIDVLSEDSDSEGIDGSADKNFPVLALEIGSLDLLTHGIGPIQHPIVIIDRQTTGLRKILVNDGAFQRSCHSSLENLPGCPETTPIREVERTVARVDDDGTWPIHACNHHQVSPVNIHRVDAIVGRISPVDLLLSPIVRDAFGINSFIDQCVQIGGGWSIRWCPRDFSPWTDLSEQQLLVLVVKVHSDYICQISDRRERHIGIVRIYIDSANFSSRSKYQVFFDIFTGATIRREFAHCAVASKWFGIVLRESEA